MKALRNILSKNKRISSIINENMLLIIFLGVTLTISFATAYFVSQSSKTQAFSSTCNVAACVEISEKIKEPQSIVVKTGDYVQFNSADKKMHNVILAHSGHQHSHAERYESGNFGADEAWKVQFKEDGSYSFVDKYNHSIAVNVVVYTPGKDYTIK